MHPHQAPSSLGGACSTHDGIREEGRTQEAEDCRHVLLGGSLVVLQAKEQQLMRRPVLEPVLHRRHTMDRGCMEAQEGCSQPACS
jgi:hypothetical protein